MQYYDNRFDRDGRRSLCNALDAYSSLWVTCSNSIMNHALAQALRKQPAIILRHSTDIYRRNSVEVPKYGHITIDFVKHQRVRHLVICAHSRCQCFWRDKDGLFNKSLNAWGSDLLERVRRRELMNDHVRRQVINQIQSWTDVPALAQQIAQGDLCVHGLFYLVESGIFTRYDASHGTFIPILDFTKLPDLLTSPEYRVSVPTKQTVSESKRR